MSGTLASHSQGAGDTSAQVLTGLWGSERVFGPAVYGALVIDGRTSEWIARVGGYEVRVQRNGDSISFVLPSDQGQFQGSLTLDRKSIRGRWIQPPVGHYPFSTPVELERSQDDVWTGTVCPLNDELSLYLVIERESNGSLAAFIRSPESNFGAHRTFRVSRDGDAVVFSNIQSKEDRIQGFYDESTDRLALRIPKRLGGRKSLVTFDFTRRDRDHAIGFFPRTPDTGTYTYRKPITEGDGWTTAALKDVGLDPKPVSEAVEKLIRTKTVDSATPYIQGLLVARHGKLVLEEYLYGFDSERSHDLRSTGKSFTSALVGIAIDQGAKFGLQTPVYSLFPEYKSFSNPDSRKLRITVKDLLTMTSGLAGNDADDSSPGNEEKMFSQDAEPDYYKFALDLPMAREPGGDHMVYFTAGINLLGGILRNTTKMSVGDFFDTYLARPLDFRGYHLNLTPSGDVYGGGGLYVRPRDALKLGQLYLDGGVWNGRRIVSKRWVDLSTQRYSGYNPEHGYGFAWHIFELRFGDRVYREYEAQGNGGQVISVIPELDLAVIFTTGNYGDDETVPERDFLGAVISAINGASNDSAAK